jgi:hypothetical protein
MRRVLLHYHIFKNAGSTIEEIFDRTFGQAFSRLETPSREGLVSNRDVLSFLEQNRRARAISSHQLRYPTPKAPGFLFLDVCILRDPIDRIRSVYDFYHSRPAPGDPLSDLAQGPIGSFVASLVEQNQLYVKNVQVNLLACAGDSDDPEDKDFQVAAERIRRAAFLGVVDCFNKSMVAGEHFLRPVFPELDCAQPAENVTGGMEGDLARRIAKVRAACDESVYNELLRLNALDTKLVDCARAEIERRFRLVPDACAKLQEFEGRISAPPGKRAGESRRKCKQEPQPSTRAETPVGQAPWVRSKQGEVESAKFAANPGLERTWPVQPLSGAPPPRERAARTDWLTKLKRLARAPLDVWLLWRCSRRYGANLFDPEYYRATYPEIGPGTNPLIHFLLRGAFEHRKPHPLFDPAFYSEKYLDVTASGANPLTHYLRRGAAQQRQPMPFFDPVFYLAHNPDVRAAAIPPLLHYVRYGANEGRKPHRLFQPDYYARGVGISNNGASLLAHFAESGVSASSPHPLFDCESYLSAHPEAVVQGVNPLAHYLSSEAGKPSRKIPELQAGAGCLEIAQFEVDDVPVAVIFCGAGWCEGQNRQPRNTLKACEKDALSGSLVVISKDASGATSIEAEPQQPPFFEAIPLEQLYAQVNAWLACE